MIRAGGTRRFLNCHTASAEGGAANPVVASLDFDGSTDYLSITNANYGTYDRKLFALACSVQADSLASTRCIMDKMSGSGTNQEWRLQITTGGAVQLIMRHADLTTTTIETTTTTITTGAWFAILVHVDRDNATAADRVKIWINGTAQSTTGTLAKDIATATCDAHIGSFEAGSFLFDGLIFSPAIFNGSLPATSAIFDGTAGKLLSFAGITGLKSLLTGSTATDDYLLTDWTNNGTVTTSATVP